MIEIANLSGMPDCENTLLMSDSTAGCFSMTKNTEGRGEGWQTTQNKPKKQNMKICKKLSKNPKVLPETCRLNIMCSLNKKGERMIKNKKQFLNESNKVNCQPEERSELRFLPVIDDSQERWSDSEHIRLVNNSPVGRFRMTKKVIPRVNEETTCQKKRI